MLDKASDIMPRCCYDAQRILDALVAFIGPSDERHWSHTEEGAVAGQQQVLATHRDGATAGGV